MEEKMSKMQGDVKSTADSSAASAAALSISGVGGGGGTGSASGGAARVHFPAGEFVSKYVTVKGWIDYTSDQSGKTQGFASMKRNISLLGPHGCPQREIREQEGHHAAAEQPCFLQ